MRNLFINRRKQDPFENWQPAPKCGVPVEFPLPDLPAFNGEPDDNTPGSTNRQRFKTMVIGLGATGDAVVGEWLKSGYFDRTENSAVSITLGSTSIKWTDQEDPDFRHFDLNHYPLQNRNWRFEGEEAYDKFRSYQTYQAWRDYLKIQFQEKYAVTIIIVGSPKEAEIGVLEPLLQALRLDIKFENVSIVGLFSVNAVRPVHDDGEIYAILREMHRFTYNGVHYSKHPESTINGLVEGVLLDHLFLLEEFVQPDTGWSIPGMDAMIHEMVEAVNALSCLSYHQELASEFRLQSQNQIDFQEKIGRPAVHSLGIFTQYIPVSKVKEYLALRLVIAALYGEDDNRQEEGLVGRNLKPIRQADSGKDIAYRWLISGPCKHPFFEWFLNNTDQTQLHTLPSENQDYYPAFKGQVCHGIMDQLTQSPSVEGLARSKKALQFLISHCTGVKRNLAIQPTHPRKIVLEQFCDRSTKLLQKLSAQLTKWQEILGWEKQAGIIDANQPRISEIINQELSALKEEFILLSNNPIRVPIVTPDEQDFVRQLDGYYLDTIRPEIRIPGAASNAFVNTRKRLGWWIESQPDDPRIYLVCLPPDQKYNRSDTIPREALFLPEHMEKFLNTMIQIGMDQIEKTKILDALIPKEDPDLSLSKQAIGSLLRYDANMAARDYRPPSDKYVVLTGTIQQARQYADIIFAGQFNANVIPTGMCDPARISAMSLRFNIPIDAVLAIKTAYGRYVPLNESRHLCIQERNAVLYEKAMKNLDDYDLYEHVSEKLKRHEIIPPRLTMALIDTQLVTLFCQAVIYQIITLDRDENGVQNWCLLPVANVEKPIKLAANTEDGLWNAFLTFTVQLPNEKNIRYTNPFHPNHRANFLGTLWRETRRRAEGTGSAQMKRTFREQYLEPYKKRNQNTELGFAFSTLMEVELQNPVWSDWTRKIN